MLKSFAASCPLAIVAALCFSPAARADSDGVQNDPEDIIVSATRIPTPEIELGSSVTSIDAAQIAARQQVTLPDILRDVPGLDIVRTGGEGGQTSVFLRGTNSNQTKVLVDGIDMSDPSTPNDAFDLGKLSSADIASVEILRGPQSGLYGSDAIGGVIDVITKSGQGPAKFSAGVYGGSFGTFDQTGSVSGSDDGFHYRLTVAHDHAGSTPVTPPDLLLPGEARNNDYYDNITASTKLGYDVTGNFDLGFVGRANNSLSRITGDASDPVTFASYPSPTQTRIDTVQYDGRATAHLVLGAVDQTLGLAYGSTHTSDMDPNNGSLPNAGKRTKLDWQGNLALGTGEVLVLGAETARDTINLPLSAGITTNAGYGELQSSLKGIFEGVDFYDSASLRHDDNSRFGGKTTWHIAPALVLENTGTKLHASIGTGFKAPSLEQLFQSFPAFFFYANPNLKPETSTGYDLGIEQRLGQVSGGVTFFHNAITNLIATDPTTFSTNINIGRARTQGFETTLAWAPWQALKLSAAYTYTEAEDADTHLELLRRPKNKASLNAEWQATEALGLDASLLYVGTEIDASRDFSVSRLRAPAYATVDLAAHYALTEQFTLYGKIGNLLDRTYQNPVGFLQPGRAVYAGIKATL